MLLKATYSCSERSAVLATNRSVQETMGKSSPRCFQRVCWLMFALARVRVAGGMCVALTLHIGHVSEYISRGGSGYELGQRSLIFCSLEFWPNLWTCIFLGVAVLDEKITALHCYLLPSSLRLWPFLIPSHESCFAVPEKWFKKGPGQQRVLELAGLVSLVGKHVREPLCCPAPETMAYGGTVLESRAGTAAAGREWVAPALTS